MPEGGEPFFSKKIFPFNTQSQWFWFPL